jgi:hypothetical protein
MNNLRLCTIVLAAAVTLPASSFASSTIVAHVLNFGAYGNGNVYAQFDQTIDQASCPQTSIELPASGTANKSFLAVLAFAQATGTAVEVKTDTCFNGSPSLDPTARSSFIISQPH